MAEDISHWLEGLGLGRYTRIFADNEIDFDVLATLTEADLSGLGLSLGARRRLQAGVRSLRETASGAAASIPFDMPPDIVGASAAERRQLSVVFCDLVGSTALSAGLDLEDMRDIISRFQQVCDATINRHGGYVAKFMGDGILAYFGYPRALENDVEQSVLAGLDLLKTVEGLSGDLETELRIRVGIATGEVVVGDVIGEGASREHAVLGVAPNLAARLQSLAAPGTVVVCDTTYRLVAGIFEFAPLGSHSLKGFAKPVPAYRVARRKEGAGYYETSVARGLAPLIGREAELALLTEEWRQANEGRAGAVLLSGEAGIGKSRVASAFRERLENEPSTHLVFVSAPSYRNSALFPVIHRFRQILGLGDEVSRAALLQPLLGFLANLGLETSTHAPVLGALLSAERADPEEIDPADPSERRERIFDSLLAVAAAMARKRPVLIVVEDLHWIDPTSLEFLSRTIEELHDSRLLLIMTCRPEFESPWLGSARVVSHTLDRLSDEESRELIAGVTRGAALPDALVAEIARRGDGVSLFVEEIARAVVDLEPDAAAKPAAIGRQGAARLGIPASLQGILAARLDRLGQAKDIAQTAAVLGRQFERRLLAAACGVDDGSLVGLLDLLIESGVIVCEGGPAGETYAFAHALIQEAAYGSLLRAGRQEKHRAAAAAIEHQLPAIAAAYPELLAHHLTESGAPARAVSYWTRAGDNAAGASANWEAVAHYRSAETCLRSAGERDGGEPAELELCVKSIPALMATHGYTSGETERVTAQAFELACRIGDTVRLPPILNAQYTYLYARGEAAKSRSLATEIMRLAELDGALAPRLNGLRSLGSSAILSGDFHAARSALEEAVGLFEDARSLPPNFEFGQDLGIAIRCLLGWSLAIVGDIDGAKLQLELAIGHARKLGHANSILYALAHKGWADWTLREFDSLARGVAETEALAQEFNAPHWAAHAGVCRAIVMAEAANYEQALDELDRADEMLSQLGIESVRLPGVVIRAQLLVDMGRTRDALACLSEIARTADAKEFRIFDSEISRLRGEALVRENAFEPAQSAFQQAIEIGRQQGAKLWELRACNSSARHARGEVEAAAARERLLCVVDTFGCGDCVDLREAGRLLSAEQ